MMLQLEETSYVASVSAPRATLAEVAVRIRDLHLNEATALEHLKLTKTPYRVKLMTMMESTYAVGSMADHLLGRGLELKFEAGKLISLVM